MASAPAYAATPKIGIVQIATANTNRDGTGTIGTLVTAGSNGSRVDRIVCCATVTTTAGMVRVFIYDGSTYRLYREIPVAAVTPSATIPPWQAEIALDDCNLPSGYSLRVSTEKAEAINVFAHSGDF